MGQFKDPDTGEIICEHQQHTYSFSKEVYKDRYGKELRNKDGKPLELVSEPKDWSDPASIPAYASFSAKTPAEKTAILKKRSRDRTFQENRELKDKKDWIDGKGRPKPKKKTTYKMSSKKKK